MQNYCKTIGLLGGMAWPSTVDYYIHLNKEIERLLGRDHSTKCIIYSYDFYDINIQLQPALKIEQNLQLGISVLQGASVDLIIICSNTIHKFLDNIRHKYAKELFLDIRDCLGTYLQKKAITQCLLLGTKLTMSNSFYAKYISGKYDIQVIVPDKENQDIINDFIFKELVNGIASAEAVRFFSSIIHEAKGETIILACTELRIAFGHIQTSKTIVDSTMVHVNATIQHILNQ